MSGNNILQPSDVDRLSQFLLIKLNPWIRSLLTVVQEYQADHDKFSLERHLNILKSETELLQRLDNELTSLRGAMSNSSSSNNSQLLFVHAMEPLAEYVALPLLAIIKGISLDWSSAQADCILQSSQWKVVALAARVYQRHIPLDNPTYPNNNQQHDQQALKVLVACAMALPSGQQLEQNQPSEAVLEKTRLDRGYDCIVALLQLMQHATATSTSSSRQKSSFSQQVASSMNGSLVARMIDTCITLLGTTTHAANASVVTASLHTLQSLLQAVPLVEVWRAAFPGCFGGLYKALLQYARSTTTRATLAVATLDTLTLLLRQTLVVATKKDTGIASKEPASENDSEQALLQLETSLQSLSLRANSTSSQGEKTTISDLQSPGSSTPSQQRQSPEETFFHQVRTRVAAPMMVLLRQLAVARAASVRQHAVSLYELMLMGNGDDNSRMMDWSNSGSATTTNVVTVALDSCMILTLDTEDAVARAAQRVVTQYGQSRPDAAPMDTIVSLMEELPALAQSQRQSELRRTLKLLSAYLAMNVPSKTLYSRLCVSGSTEWLQSIFTTINDLDFESFDSTMASSVSIVAPSSAIHRPNQPLHRYLDEDTRVAASQFTNRLGRALGSKYVSLLVDACIAELYESLAHRMERQSVLSGASQAAWLHEKLGTLVFAMDLLAGAFLGEPENQRKRNRKLIELSDAVLPILICGPLFDLPSSSRLLEESQSEAEGANLVSVTSALRGNAAFTFASLDLVATIFVALGDSSKRFLSLALFPILEKASWLYPASVQDMAVHVLDQMARSVGFKGPAELIVANIDTVMSSMNTRLRIPGGSMMASQFTLDRNVMLVAMATASLLRLLCFDKQQRSQCLPSDGTVLSRLEELFGNLALRFDHQAVLLANKNIESLIFLELFDATLSFLFVSNGIPHTGEASHPLKCESLSFDWKRNLEPFEVDLGESLAPAEGFALMRNHSKPSSPTDPEGLNRAILASQLLFISDILSRSSYLLSHTSLKVQIASCKILIRGFRFLGWVAIHVPELEEESNGPTTAILRQVHTHWPSISARLKATASSMTTSETQQSSSLLVPVGNTPETTTRQQHHGAEQRVFLSQLFILVGIMCECAGDFMSRHYREVIWPCLGQAVGSFLPPQATLPKNNWQLMARKCTRSHAAADSKRLYQQNRRLSESDYGLLLGIFRCVSSVYAHRPMGLSVANLIAPAGTMLLPFLEHERLYSAGIEAIKKMLCIDCDSLNRQLMTVAGQPIPKCVWSISEAESQKETATAANGANVGRLEMAARALLDFIDTLPEQSLE